MPLAEHDNPYLDDALRLLVSIHVPLAEHDVSLGYLLAQLS